MCKIYKSTGAMGVNANPYIFKNFNLTSYTKAENKSEPAFQNEVVKAEDELKGTKVQAKKILEAAQQQADSIIKKAMQEANLMKNRAVIDGYQSGITSASQKIEEFLSEANKTTQGLIESTKTKTQEVFSELEQNSLQIALDIAKKVLTTELDRNDTHLINVIKQGLQKVQNQTEAKLILHTDDLNRLSGKEAFEQLAQKYGIQLQVVSNDNLEQGDILIQTEGEMIDAGINTQFNNIKTLVMQT